MDYELLLEAICLENVVHVVLIEHVVDGDRFFSGLDGVN